MLDSLVAIQRLKNGDRQVLKEDRWLMFLSLTSERNINFERLYSLDEMNCNYILCYVEKTLNILSQMNLNKYQTYLIEETLKWSEVAKSGLKNQREQWIKEGFSLFAHNIGSAQIYLEQSMKSQQVNKPQQGTQSEQECQSCKEEQTDRANQCKDMNQTSIRIVQTLITTHGLIGQYLRGEVPLTDNLALYQLVKDNLISATELKEILIALNCCVIKAVKEEIWVEIREQVTEVIDLILDARFERQYSIKERLRRLRAVSIKNGEDFEEEYSKVLSDTRVADRITQLLQVTDLWYVEAALFDFSFEEFIKIFLIIAQGISNRKTDRKVNNSERIKHISFEWFMKELYYQHEGKKRVNIYKKRIIEKYLSGLTLEDILEGDFKDNLHVTQKVIFHENLKDTVFFTFQFSAAGSKLIDFCMEAEKSDVLYESAIILLFDLFGLRKDKYDRFYEEESYLQTMNQTIDYKKVILDYITGESILDIGPGGGALMDLIEDRYPQKKVAGVDISQNVLDSLKKKKQLENRKWDVLYGDALNLGQTIEKGKVDTVIFCSILHELYSYIEYKGKKFNHETLAAAFQSAFEVLPIGGRIIIRDGIMTEPVSEQRIIKFLSEEGMEFVSRYAKDFQGRAIEFTVIGQNEVLMPVNDAMECLYTYTWGEKSYVHEVNEQFGYFTPGGFKEFIYSVLGSEAKIVEFKHYLQDGYTTALSQKVKIFDENRKPIRLPDSTCIVVIEKVTG